LRKKCLISCSDGRGLSTAPLVRENSILHFVTKCNWICNPIVTHILEGTAKKVKKTDKKTKKRKSYLQKPRFAAVGNPKRHFISGSFPTLARADVAMPISFVSLPFSLRGWGELI
ncbi:MAG: hypothetical protein VB100_13110, partial [Angelakisella sp.]|nr:hypothetical protein [Angelakisella sp.]